MIGDEMPEVYTVQNAEGEVQPILVSVPHSGTHFPASVRSAFKPEVLSRPVDTDWFVDRLYDFAPAMGMTLVCARLSRFVVDLNRNPVGAALYDDGRLITDVVPTTSFTGESIYLADGPDNAERERRLQQYFLPYHEFLALQLAQLRQKFNHVLLWDCHSIKQVVPTIRPEAFPDLILGDADGSSAAVRLSQTALKHLRTGGEVNLSHNAPFKGGFITRSFGDPDAGIHAIQLEMTQPMYMDEAALAYDETKAERMRSRLRLTFEALLAELEEMQ